MGKRLLSRNHILLRKLYRNISKSEQKNQKRRFKKYRFISNLVIILVTPPLWANRNIAL